MGKMNNFNLKQFNSEIFNFLCEHKSFDNYFKLTKNSDYSVFSHCFGIFILNNIKKLEDFNSHYPIWTKYIIQDILNDNLDKNFRFNKPKMQKLCFGLSALSLMNELPNDDINNLIIRIIDYDPKMYLEKIGFYKNRPQSANFCMFFSILLLYSINDLKIKKNKIILDDFIKLQFNKIDNNGFFNDNIFNHLAFQNFYHQFEIFDYLGKEIPNLEIGISKIISLYNYNNFRNAPYFGSSGCYDFDAISLVLKSKYIDTLYLDNFFNYILSQRNSDFGFSESKDIRPLNVKYFFNSIIHIATANNFSIFKERLKYILNYTQKKYNKLDTHWTIYSRNWNESNLWDTWLKIQIIYKILLEKNIISINDVNFINFPGMGFYNFKR
jgi:hypothetical protein